MTRTPLPLAEPAVNPRTPQGRPPPSEVRALPQDPCAPPAPPAPAVACPHRQQLASLGMMTGEIAHDCNTLLAVILSTTHLALADVPPHSRLWQQLQHVHSAGRRTQALVRQLLLWSAQRPPERRPIRLHEVIATTVTLLRGSLPTTITLRHRIAPDAGVICADAGQIQQVVLNLWTNAVQAMHEQGGSLAITWEAVADTTRGGTQARLTVQDTGPGIAPALLERLFEPLVTTTAGQGGTGLGLAIVQRIVAQHGGEIRVRSTVGQGTTVEVDLPRFKSGGTRASC